MAKNIGWTEDLKQDGLKKLGLAAVILIAVVAAGYSFLNGQQDMALKTAPIMTPQLQKEATDKQIQQVQNDPTMPEQAKQATIAMIKSHSSISGAIPASPSKK